MKKLDGCAAELVKEDVETNPALKQKLLQAKKNIIDGNVYSTEDLLEMID